MTKEAKKPKKSKKNQPPDRLPAGIIFEDIFRNKWKLGPSFDKGGCGEIYLTQKYPSSDENDYPYIMKIEYHENSPLQCELHFLVKHAKQKHIDSYKTEKKLSSLGISPYVSSGAPVYGGRDYRFIVLEKLGPNLDNVLNENGKKLPPQTVFQLAVQILDALEYIHSRGCVHGDVKGSNILLGKDDEAKKQVYLIDFGLSGPVSLKEEPNKNNAHNGTPVYISRDGHLGIESKRGDLEILGYNLVHWLGYELPWENNLSNYAIVQENKIKYLNNLTDYFKTCFENDEPPSALVQYMQYVTTLQFNTNPDYQKLRNIFITAIDSTGASLDSEFNFTLLNTPAKRQRGPSFTSTEEPNKKRMKFDDETNYKTTNENASKTFEKKVASKSLKKARNKIIKTLKSKKYIENGNVSSRLLRPRKKINYAVSFKK